MFEAQRRKLLERTFYLLSAAIASVVGAPIAIAFFDPARRKTVSGGADAGNYGKVSDLTPGVPRKMDVVGARIDAWDRTDPKPIGALWLVRGSDDRVSAFSGVCPHLGCPIGYDDSKRVFACPCHESAYAVADGARLKGPALRGLDPLPVEVRDGEVQVTYKRFVQGIASRREV